MKRINVIATQTDKGIERPFTFEVSNKAVFELYVESILCPILRPNQVVVMDNASFHKSKKVKELINELFYQECDQVNGASFIEFLKGLEKSYDKALTIHLIVDRGPSHTSKEVKAFLEKGSRIKLHFLPAYSPNLNPIERVWKIMHEYVSNNKYYATGKLFKVAIREFFTKTIHNIKEIIQSRLTDKFSQLYT